ncbi:uncharacterized protein CLUP02_11513 [Colletotrichum lupini]|uniref:Uncharacterized protein n=1 Tax=Colletotrichum lupini TaxID=145971 RepID=A0A9Q8SYR1_9PEZI|nr:uncharacterized protein CLUP02_11513 [Colletotrichum lupini]UQC86014.1 hypothetical protein CLUP02_11513 [Colletotrichum lupini]
MPLMMIYLYRGTEAEDMNRGQGPLFFAKSPSLYSYYAYTNGPLASSCLSGQWSGLVWSGLTESFSSFSLHPVTSHFKASFLFFLPPNNSLLPSSYLVLLDTPLAYLESPCHLGQRIFFNKPTFLPPAAKASHHWTQLSKPKLGSRFKLKLIVEKDTAARCPSTIWGDRHSRVLATATTALQGFSDRIWRYSGLVSSANQHLPGFPTPPPAPPTGAFQATIAVAAVAVCVAIADILP